MEQNPDRRGKPLDQGIAVPGALRVLRSLQEVDMVGLPEALIEAGDADPGDVPNPLGAGLGFLWAEDAHGRQECADKPSVRHQSLPIHGDMLVGEGGTIDDGVHSCASTQICVVPH